MINWMKLKSWNVDPIETERLNVSSLLRLRNANERLFLLHILLSPKTALHRPTDRSAGRSVGRPGESALNTANRRKWVAYILLQKEEEKEKVDEWEEQK